MKMKKLDLKKGMNKMMSSINTITFGKIPMDKDLKVGLVVIIALLIIGLLIKNIISELVENMFIFMILFLVSFLITHNWMVSLVVGGIFYMVVSSMRDLMKKREGFENEKDAGVAEKDDSEEDKKFLKTLSKNEKSDDNIEEEPVTKEEKRDMDRNQGSVEEMKKMAEKFQGGIKLKDEDMKETPELNIDFRNTKYSEDKMSPQKKAQMETYELMNSIKNLESTIKGLSPVLTEGKKIMDMFEQYNLDGKK